MGVLQAFQVQLLLISNYTDQTKVIISAFWTTMVHDSLKKSSLSSYKIFYNSNGNYIKMVIFLETQLELLKLVHHVSNIFETSEFLQMIYTNQVI
jgi:hypothetical protein